MSLEQTAPSGTSDTRTIAFTAAAVVVLDQITKALCLAYLPLHSRMPLVEGMLTLTHVRNRGMAFGLFSGIDASWLRWVLVLVAIAAVGIIWSYARQERQHAMVSAALGLILGGAVGNLIDRLRFGYVVDFILAHWDEHEFPAFNVADAAITVGGLTLFFVLAREGDGEQNPASTSTAAGGESEETPVPPPDPQR